MSATSANALFRPDRNWPLVAAGAVLGCVAVGVLFSLSVLLGPMSAATGWTRAGLSGAMTLAFLAMGLAGFGWGALGDRIGPRKCALVGSLLLGLACILASRSRTLLEFQLAYGVLVGAAGAAFFAPVIAAVASSFDKRRNIAISLVSAGVGVAPLTLSPLVAWLASRHDWRTTLFVIGVLAWAVTLPAVWFVRTGPMPSRAGGTDAAGASIDTGADTGADTGTGIAANATTSPPMRVGEALRSRAFIILALAFFCCCAAHSGPIFHTVSYAVGCGLTVTTAVTIYSMEGAAGLGGRLLCGVLADRWGAKPVLVAGLAIQGIAATSYLAAVQLGSFYAVAIVFGMAYGGTMPLYASLARDAFSPAILGTVLGAATMLSSLGMALGPLIGGWLFDHYGSYVWLYIGSGAMGIAAAAIALCFPTPRRNTRGNVPPLVPVQA